MDTLFYCRQMQEDTWKKPEGNASLGKGGLGFDDILIVAPAV